MIPVLRWDQVVLYCTNQRWRELLSLAKLLLGERFQTTTSGAAVGFSLLFEMNTLFEEYVGRMLGRALAKDGLMVQRKGGHLYCLKELDGGANSRFQTIPDIRVRRGSEILLVVDTKWKRLSARVDDPKQGVAQADVYQMLAYSRIYCCPRMMLLYPHHGELGGMDPFPVRYGVTGSDDELAIGTIDVGDADGISGAVRLIGQTSTCLDFRRGDTSWTLLAHSKERPLSGMSRYIRCGRRGREAGVGRAGRPSHWPMLQYHSGPPQNFGSGGWIVLPS